MKIQSAKKELSSYLFDVQLYYEKIKDLKRNKQFYDELSGLLFKNEKSSEIIEIFETTDMQLLEIIQKKQNMENMINKLPQPYKTVMYMRYILSLAYTEIASRMNYSVKRIYQLHSKGIELYAEQKDEH